MRATVRLVPAFGFAIVLIPQPCGCLELKVMLGPAEAGVITGRWCRNRDPNAPQLPLPDPMAPMFEALARSGAIPAWKIAALREEIPGLMALPPERRVSALLRVIEDLAPGAMTVQDETPPVANPPAAQTQPDRTQ